MSLLTEQRQSTSARIVAPEISLRQLAILFGGRLLVYSAVRAIYPLLPFLVAHFAVAPTVASLAVTGVLAAGLAAPVGRLVADRAGSVFVMRIGLMCVSVGLVLCGWTKTFEWFLVGCVLIGLGSALYVPATQSWTRANSRYRQRVKLSRVLNSPWPLSALFGAALICFVVTGTATFSYAYGALLVLTTTAYLCSCSLRESISQSRDMDTGRIDEVFVNPSLLSVSFVTLLILIGYELVILPFCGWAQTACHLADWQLALLFGSLGLAELAGSGIAIISVEKFGKYTSLILACLAMSLCECLLPLSACKVAATTLLFLLFGLSAQICSVCIGGLAGGVLPGARGAVLSLNSASATTARVTGSLCAMPVFLLFGFATNAIAAGVITLLAVLIAACRSKDLRHRGVARV